MRRTLAVLAALTMAALTGCSGGGGEPGDLYTPTGGLTRQLFLAANEQWTDLCELYGLEEMGRPDCPDRVKRAFEDFHVIGIRAYQEAGGWVLSDDSDGSATLSGDGATLSGYMWENGYELTSARMSKVREYWVVDLD